MHRTGDETTAYGVEEFPVHPEQWWAQFPDVAERFDTALLVDGFNDLLAPRIGNPLLRREVELAAATVRRALERPENEELAEEARAIAHRLTGTIDRIN